MNTIKKIALIVLSLGIFGNINAQENEAPYTKGDTPGLFPGFKEGFHPQISIAPQVGYILFSDANNTGGVAYGAEIALQCPLACTKKNYIRQQVSFLYYAEDNFKFWSATLNPEYRFLVKPQFELAAGPALGVSNINLTVLDVSIMNETGFTYGLSTSATFHFNKVFVGISPRYMLSTTNNFGGNFNSFQGLVKIGFNL